MKNSRLRWLLPPESDRSIGYHDGSEVAEVWPEGLCGNQIARWNWKLLDVRVTGVVPGSGNDAIDRRAAQYEADNAFFTERSTY